MVTSATWAWALVALAAHFSGQPLQPLKPQRNLAVVRTSPSTTPQPSIGAVGDGERLLGRGRGVAHERHARPSRRRRRCVTAAPAAAAAWAVARAAAGRPRRGRRRSVVGAARAGVRTSLSLPRCRRRDRDRVGRRGRCRRATVSTPTGTATAQHGDASSSRRRALGAGAWWAARRPQPSRLTGAMPSRRIGISTKR